MMHSASEDPRPAVPTVGEWLALLARERVLLADLGMALARQRDAVAHDRVAEVHASADDMQRILHTLERTRRRSGEMRELLAPEGTAVPPEVLAAGAQLHAEAVWIRREASINHDVLRHCITAGETFLQELFSSLEPGSGYAPGESREESTPALLLDRRA